MALRQFIFMPLQKIGSNSSFITHMQRQSFIYRQNILNSPKGSNSLRYPSFRSNSNVQGFQSRPTPFDSIPSNLGPINSTTLWKSLLFTAAFSTGTFVTVSIWEYEQIRSRALKTLKNYVPFNWFKQKMSAGHRHVQTWQKDMGSWWSSQSPAEKLFIPLCGLNMLVFGLWRVKKIQPFMLKYFVANPAARIVCWPMLLSTFSHYSAFHIFANMYVLHSFINAAVNSLGKEQFLGLYLTAGVFASCASNMYKVMAARSGMSLGASGAIMCILAYVCAQYPNTQLSLIFLPMYQFSAGIAIKCIMGIDLAGLILGWKYFDHAAHLGGAALGLFWCYYGSQHIWPKREYILKEYHKLRSPSPPAK